MEVQPHLLNLSAYINQNLEKELPLSSLAKRVGLSPFHFHRKFGAYFGESLHQHIKRLRLERAAYALVNGTTPVRQIALDSGYKTVSAFSHAFSGFAGESPTRYRNQAMGKDDGDAVDSDPLEPVWIGELPPQGFAFVRTKGNGHGTQQAIQHAIGLVAKLVGPLPRDTESSSSEGRVEEGDAMAGANGEFAFIAATSDLYGVARSTEFRLDVGLDATRVPTEKLAALGRQTLPGGRYARFDFICKPDDAISQRLNATIQGLKKAKHTPRLSQYFMRFDGEKQAQGTADASIDYRLFVPLAD